MSSMNTLNFIGIDISLGYGSGHNNIWKIFTLKGHILIIYKLVSDERPFDVDNAA